MVAAIRGGNKLKPCPQQQQYQRWRGVRTGHNPYTGTPKYTGTPGNAAQGQERWLAVGYKAVAHVHPEPWPRNPDAI